MPKQSRRFELLLPTKLNNGDPVPWELVADTLLDIEQQFGAVSSETQRIRGRWRFQDQVYRDESIRVFVDVDDTAESRKFFVDLKEKLKERFQQIDIWMTTYLVEVI